MWGDDLSKYFYDAKVLKYFDNNRDENGFNKRVT